MAPGFRFGRPCVQNFIKNAEKKLKNAEKKLEKVLQISELCSMLYNREEFGAISDQ